MVTPALHQDLQVLLSERRAGWSVYVYGSASPDREDTANFFEAWSDVARCLSIRPRTAKYKAIAKLWDLLQALYCTYQDHNPLNCAAVASDFHGTVLWLQHHGIYSASSMTKIPCCRRISHLGWLSSQVTFRKASTAFCNPGGGAVWWGGWTRCPVVSGRPSIGRPMCKHSA